MKALCIFLIPVTVFAQTPKDWIDDLPPAEIFDIGRHVLARRYYGKEALSPPPVNFEDIVVQVDGDHILVSKKEDQEEKITHVEAVRGWWLGPLFLGGLYSWTALWAFIIKSWNPFYDVTIGLLFMVLVVSIWNTFRGRG